MLFWRGWGILVFFRPFVWIFILLGVLLGSGSQPDPAKAAAAVDRMFALAFALSAATVLFIARYRERTAPKRDDFMFIPMKYWPWLLGVAALGFVAPPAGRSPGGNDDQRRRRAFTARAWCRRTILRPNSAAG
jgi:hypothetical protein